MQKPIDIKQVKDDILSELHEKKLTTTTDTSRDDVNSRGDACLELIRQSSVL